MKGERHVGGEIRVLSNLIKRCMDDGTPEITGMRAVDHRLLHRNEDRDMFQRDVEAEFNIRRSTATGILQLMEKNGFLLREPVAYDARLKKLVLTPRLWRARGRDLPHPRHRGTHHQRRHARRAGAIFRHHSQIHAIWSECPPLPFHAAGAGAAFPACRQRFSSAYIVRKLTVMALTS